MKPALAPLAHLAGARPPAPPWFQQAIACAPERRLVEADGVQLETLVWGPAGAPGLLFIHGNGAHADWWSFIAPFFANNWRVAAFSFSGMGGSGWRPSYSTEQSAREALAVMRAVGLHESAVKPTIVGHSFGGLVATFMASEHAGRLRAAIVADPPFTTPERARRWREKVLSRPPRTFANKVYPTLPEALARFRFMPPQTCEHIYVADHIARHSLLEVEGGWTWRFDPQLMSKMTVTDFGPVLAATRCPVALIHGERSRIVGPDDLAYVWSALPPRTPKVMLPDADHHLMVDQPLAFVAALRGLLASWPDSLPA